MWNDEQDILATAWFHKRNIRISGDAASGLISSATYAAHGAPAEYKYGNTLWRDYNCLISFFIAVLDPATGNVEYCNAGHNPPIVVHTATDEIETLGAPGTGWFLASSLITLINREAAI